MIVKFIYKSNAGANHEIFNHGLICQICGLVFVQTIVYLNKCIVICQINAHLYHNACANYLNI